MIQPKRDYLFITGMARSGTTLLDKLIHNHGAAMVLSQPLPLLFYEIKKSFYSRIGHPPVHYVMGNLFQENSYSQDDFNTFLQQFILEYSNVESALRNKEMYSGQLKRYPNFKELAHKFSKFTLSDSLKTFLNDCAVKESTICGLKEIYLEEFTPYFIGKKWKVIIIVRDPRSVIYSMNFGNGQTHSGQLKPTLFNLRNWRKSVQFIRKNINAPNFLFLRYEDLISNPKDTLQRVSRFLSINNFPIDTILKTGLFDEYGNLWKGNSSFIQQEVFFTKSAELYKDGLSKNQIQFIECYTAPEMIWLNYPFVELSSIPRFISDLLLEDPFELTNKNCSCLTINLESERNVEWQRILDYDFSSNYLNY